MDEAAWLSSNDPAAMLSLVSGDWRSSGPHSLRDVTRYRATDRKLRLFAAACARQVWPLLTDDGGPCGRCWGRGVVIKVHPDFPFEPELPGACPDCAGTGRVNRSRRAVEVAKRFADGLATEEERRAAYHAAGLVVVRGPDATSSPFEAELAWKCAGPVEVLTANAGLPRWFSVSTKHAADQAALLRDIVGNPFRPALPYRQTEAGSDGDCYDYRLSTWLAWNDGTVPKLAQAIYRDNLFGGPCEACGGERREAVVGRHCGGYDCGATYRMGGCECGCRECTEVMQYREKCPVCRGTGRRPNHLPTLADALEDSGCDCVDLIEHLRGRQRCPKCLGTRENDIGHPNGPVPCAFCDAGWVSAGPVCGRCKGRRFIPDAAPGGDAIPCPDCGGTGKLPAVHARGCWAVDLLRGTD